MKKIVFRTISANDLLIELFRGGKVNLIWKPRQWSYQKSQMVISLIDSEGSQVYVQSSPLNALLKKGLVCCTGVWSGGKRDYELAVPIAEEWVK